MKALSALFATSLALQAPHLYPVDGPHQDKFLDPEELIISTGTYPCIFKVNDSFYDYTPLKVAIATEGLTPEAVQYNNPLQRYYFNFCQYLSDSETSTCQGSYYAAGKKANEEGCVPYSGSDPSNDIKVDTLPLNSVLLSNGTMSEPI